MRTEVRAARHADHDVARDAARTQPRLKDERPLQARRPRKSQYGVNAARCMVRDARWWADPDLAVAAHPKLSANRLELHDRPPRRAERGQVEAPQLRQAAHAASQPRRASASTNAATSVLARGSSIPYISTSRAARVS